MHAAKHPRAGAARARREGGVERGGRTAGARRAPWGLGGREAGAAAPAGMCCAAAAGSRSVRPDGPATPRSGEAQSGRGDTAPLDRGRRPSSGGRGPRGADSESGRDRVGSPDATSPRGQPAGGPACSSACAMKPRLPGRGRCSEGKTPFTPWRNAMSTGLKSNVKYRGKRNKTKPLHSANHLLSRRPTQQTSGFSEGFRPRCEPGKGPGNRGHGTPRPQLVRGRRTAGHDALGEFPPGTWCCPSTPPPT